MIGLSDDEARVLAEAKATAHAAQAIIDHLESKSRDARLKKFQKLWEVQRATKPRILPEKFREQHDFPKPASKLPRHPKQRFRWKPAIPPEADVVRESFELTKSFGGLAATHGLDRYETLKALRGAGVDIYEEVAREWDRGTPMQELSRRHGVGRDTIARWIRKAGRNINPRNGNWRYDEALIAKTFDETGSVNKAAGVSWDTARAVLSRYDIRAVGRSQPASTSRTEAEIPCHSSPHS